MRLGLREVRISFAQITPEMIETFAYGECVALASAMRRHTGWPYAIAWLDESTFNHVGVRTPDGRFLDICGAHTDVEVLRSGAWKGRQHTFISESKKGEIPHLNGTLTDELLTWLKQPLACEAVLYLAEFVVCVNGYGEHLRSAA
jgi:hypothetical protein